MASVSKYLSVLKPCTTGGSFSFSVKSRPTSADVVTVTGSFTIAPGDVQSVAAQLNAGINAKFGLANVLYQGIPSFELNGLPFALLLRAIQCDHVVNVWSQVDFSLSITSNDSDAVITVQDIPIFPTFADALSKSSKLIGTSFIDDCGNPFSDEEMIDALLLGSQEIINYLEGYVVIKSQYLHEQVGNFTNGYQFTYYPIIDHDIPYVYGTLFPSPLGLNLNGISSIYMVNSEDGVLSFNKGGVLSISPYWYHPLNYNTVLRQTYVAGMSSVHKILKTEAIREIGFASSQSDQYESATTAQGTVKFRAPEDRRDLVRLKLSRIGGT